MTDLKPETFVVAEGTEFERELIKKLPRGRRNRGITAKIIQSISGFGSLEEGNFNIVKMGGAMSTLFDFPDFDDVLLPTVLGLADANGKVLKEDKEWLDNLSDMEIFEAYMEMAMFIVGSGNLGEQVATAQKK